MSEMTMPDTETESDNLDDSSKDTGETSPVPSSTDDNVNTALTDDSNQDGDPNDDRMGAPPVMPD